MRHRREQTRRCGVAAQRWRFTVSAVSGHGPAMHSTRLHANAAAAVLLLLLLLLLMTIILLRQQ